MFMIWSVGTSCLSLFPETSRKKKMMKRKKEEEVQDEDVHIYRGGEIFFLEAIAHACSETFPIFFSPVQSILCRDAINVM